MTKHYDIFLYLIGCSTIWGVNSNAALADSLRTIKIAQLNPDSSGVVGDSFEDDIREKQLIDPLIIPSPVTPRRKSTPVPGSTIGVPSAYGASWGDAYIGASGAITDEDVVDAAASVGLGFGNPNKSLGLEVGLGIASIDTGSGLIGFKIHRSLGNDTKVAVGWANAITWGNLLTAGDTIYGALTHRFELQPNNEDNQLPLTMTLGVGSGAYQSTGSLSTEDNAPNVFASAGFRVIPRVSLISSWTGNQLNVGTSFAPLNAPFTINIAATDVTDNREGVGEQISRTGLLVSTGYVFNF